MTAAILDQLLNATSDTTLEVSEADFKAIFIDLEMACELSEVGPNHFTMSTPDGQLNLHQDTNTLIWVYDPIDMEE